MVAMALIADIELSTWARCFQANAAFNEAAGRTGPAWFVANPVMFLAFLGVPAAVLFLRRCGVETNALIRQKSTTAARSLPLATGAVIVGLWIFGVNLGEVERLWMPLMPLAALVGLGRLELNRTAVLAVLALQGLQAIAFRMSLDTLGLKRIIMDAGNAGLI
jgi:hypothetical protein